VQSRELYQRYHRLILKLAREGQSRSGSLVRLRELLAQFELEAAGIAPDSVRFLREQLSEQLEHEALVSAHSDRRYVLFAAVKRLEQLSDRN
jgi:acetyl/propionyl-CoA carboxylase alpha subunit